MMTYSALSHLSCSRTGAAADADIVQGVSAAGAPLLARYDVERAARTLTRDALARRPATLWRYHEMLPVRDPRFVTTLGEGMTPLLPLARYGARIGLPKLLMKDESLIPTATFKARGAAVGVSRARELGVTGVAMPTNGNAGAAWAAYAARAGLSCLIGMPLGAPEINRAECVVAGAELHLVDGLIGDAAKVIGELVADRPGVQEVSTLREPYRLEGKKTMGYEIVEQFTGLSMHCGEAADDSSAWRVPDVILYPAGGGVGLIGIFKALGELRELGWIDGPPPRLVAVQAAGCAPIVRAFEAGAAESEPFPDARTVAFGITVPKPLGDFLMLDAIRATGGTAIAVTDDELLAEQRRVAADEGTFICPEGAACLAAAARLRDGGFLAAADEVVVLNTGSGLKYPFTVPA
jgi:threonine synthase